MNVDYRFIKGDKKLSLVPRVGMMMSLPEGFENLEWFGRGPWENYSDRKTAAFIDHYKCTVTDQYFAYASPQECGYKTDNRWMLLKNKEDKALLIESNEVFGFSALHFTSEDLTQDNRGSKHTTDMEPRKETILNVDHSLMGVGGDNSWGAKPHKQYSIEPMDFKFSFTMKLFSSSKEVKKYMDM